MFTHADGRLLVFARAPVPGQVKTRLMAKLDGQACAQLQRWFIGRALKTATHADLCSVDLWCAPDCGHPFFGESARRFGVKLQVQQGHDLGARMYQALAVTLAHAEFGLIVGCDCPALNSAYLAKACEILASGVPIVLGPAEDGGYVLIGMCRTPLIGTRMAAAELFKDIAWGTPSVLDQTRARLHQLGWRWRELAPLWDVDRPGDLNRLASEELGAPIPPATPATRLRPTDNKAQP